jgi:hypothetical protein
LSEVDSEFVEVILNVAAGTDRIVTMTFRLFDVTIKGSGLLQLIRDAKRHRIDVLAVSPRHRVILGGEGVIVTELFVTAAK